MLLDAYRVERRRYNKDSRSYRVVQKAHKAEKSTYHRQPPRPKPPLSEGNSLAHDILRPGHLACQRFVLVCTNTWE